MGRLALFWRDCNYQGYLSGARVVAYVSPAQVQRGAAGDSRYYNEDMTKCGARVVAGVSPAQSRHERSKETII